MAATQDPIDPTKAGQYPVILSDTLLRRRTTESFTTVRYNFMPGNMSSQVDKVILPAADSGSPNSYNLSFTDKADEFVYQGTQNPGESQYVLVFSPERQAFILHQVDSSFDMNVTSTPWDSDADSLLTVYGHITDAPVAPNIPKKTTTTKRRKAVPGRDPQPTQSLVKSQAKAPSESKNQVNKAPTKQAKAVVVELQATPEEEESEVKIVDPDGPPRGRSNHSAAVPIVREPEPSQRGKESSGDESEDDEDERDRGIIFDQPPSPAHIQDSHDYDVTWVEMDLETALAQALPLQDGAETSESEEE